MVLTFSLIMIGDLNDTQRRTRLLTEILAERLKCFSHDMKSMNVIVFSLRKENYANYHLDIKAVF